MAKNGKEIVAVQPLQFLALNPAKADVVVKNLNSLLAMGIRESKLEQIKVPTGGGLSFELATLAGPIPVQTFDGIILYYREHRAWWEKSYEETGGGEVPDCYSLADDRETNMIYGKAKPDSKGPGMKCRLCPFNKWGSDPKGGNGKACKERVRAYMYRPSNMLPSVLRIPTGSLQTWQDFILALMNADKLSYETIIQIGLKQEQQKAAKDRKGGLKYSVLTFASTVELSPEQTAEMEALKAIIEEWVIENNSIQDEVEGFDGDEVDEEEVVEGEVVTA